VAIIEIPSIGVHGAVVVQGTTPQNLMVGPGHLPDTPLPGQTGVAVIYGRRAAFGGPFSHLAQLRPGATITAITGQGTSTYTVAAVADSRQIIKDTVPDRLVLLTASSPVIPSYYIEVDARLASPPRPSAGVVRTVYPSELPMAGDPATLSLTMAWALALALVAAVGTIAALRWSFWPAYLAVVPVALAVLWNLYESLAALLPNMY
jgi:sortase A